MAEQFLNGPNVVAIFQEICGKEVPKWEIRKWPDTFKRYAMADL